MGEQFADEGGNGQEKEGKLGTFRLALTCEGRLS